MKPEIFQQGHQVIETLEDTRLILIQRVLSSSFFCPTQEAIPSAQSKHLQRILLEIKDRLENLQVEIKKVITQYEQTQEKEE